MGSVAPSFDVELINVTKRYGEVTAVDGIDVRVGHGQFYALLGPSGCGKTTTLRLIAGFEHPDEGSIRVAGREVADLPPYRRDVNTVFQHYALFPHMTVAENVAFGLQQRRVPGDEIGRRVAAALDLVHLGAHGRRRPAELSGGQQQRVALARALVNRPAVLLLDEPLGALDLKLRKEMQAELKELQQQVGITFVFVTHDQEEALTMADRIAVMEDGHVLQEGPPREIYERPSTRFVAAFIGLTNFLDGEVVERRDGRLLVRTGESLKAWCISDRAIPVGSDITLAIRPEKIEIRAEPSANAPNCWRGVVVAGTFLGDQTEYRVLLDGGPEVLVRRQNLGINGANVGIAPGAPVHLAFDPEISLLLPRSAGHPEKKGENAK